MNFILVDDVQAHHAILAEKIEAVCNQLHLPCSIALATTHWQEALDYARNAPQYSVYFLDIELSDEINGIELCQRIRKQNPLSYIVFVSAYQQYALLCCQSHAFDFLLKPWTDDQLRDCLKAICGDILQRETVPCLEVRLGTRHIRLPIDQIVFFSKDGMNLIAHCTDSHLLTWRETVEKLAERLPPEKFIQIHKSYIVNLKHVSEFRWADDVVILDNGESLPISRRREEEIKKLLVAAPVM